MNFIIFGESCKKRLRLIVVVAGMLCCCFQPAQVSALQLYQSEDFTASFDTTLSYSLQYRVQDQDESIIANTAGGTNVNPNADDGNLNYDKGIFNNMFKIISDLELKSKHFGAFARGTAFYDFENEDGSRERYELSDDAKELVGSDVKLLDAYVWTGVDSGALPFQIRVGEQVINWGESTFILGGIGLNTFNPIDVSKLHVPGAELRDALLPEGMVYGSVGFLESFTLEGVYLYSYTETELDPVGSYWGTTDFAGKGDKKLVAPNYYLAGLEPFLGAQAVGDMGNASVEDTIFAIPMGEGVYPDHQGQFGVALRHYAAWLNNTEFSLYYLNYHSKMPTLNARTGTLEGLNNAGAAAQAAAAAAMSMGLDAATAGQIAQAAALNTYLKSCQYRVQYQEDIPTIAAGWSTELLGWGFQGEISHRKDVALQVDDTELLAAMVGSINPGIAAVNQIGDFYGQFETWLTDSIERDQSQIQITISKLLGPLLGSSGSTFLAEAGWQHTHNMPDKSELRLMTFNAHGTGNAALAPALTPGFAAEPSSLYPDSDAWGYVLLGFLDYDNVIGPLSLSPRLAWSHDVYGTSPNGGPFYEGRKAITYGLGFRYLSRWTADLSYTCYFGAGDKNLINDRDFLGLSIKTSF